MPLDTTLQRASARRRDELSLARVHADRVIARERCHLVGVQARAVHSGAHVQSLAAVELDHETSVRLGHEPADLRAQHH